MNRLLVLILGLSLAIPASGMELARTALSAAPHVATAYALHYSLTYCHELGHSIALKLLLDQKSKIYISPNPLGPSYCKPIGKSEKRKQLSRDSYARRKAAVYFAGPLFGIGASTATLLASTIISEYMQGKTISSACISGLQKPLLNKDQNLCMQLPAVWNLINNIGQLVLLDYLESDGAQVLRKLGISNPAHQYPNIYPITYVLGLCSIPAYAYWMIKNILAHKK